MRIHISTILLIASLTACSTSTEETGASDTAEEEVPLLDITPTDAPAKIDRVGTFYKKVPYGDDSRNVFDLALPEGEGPFPLILFVHGGGFTSGNKSEPFLYYPEEVQQALDAGAAYASINYRLIEEMDADGVIKPLGDVMRGLQTIRYHSEQLQIDPERVAIYGTSAGAGTSLWIGLNDDLADPASDDPVERQSTSVSAIGAVETQATYDIVRWETDIFDDFGITLELAVSLGLEQVLLDFYGAPDIDSIYTDDFYIDYRDRVDMLDMVDANDPPVYLISTSTSAEMPVSVGALYHHPYHADAVRLAAEEVGLEVESYLPELEVDTAEGGTVDFLLRYLD